MSKAWGRSSFASMSVDWASEKQREAFEYGPMPLCCSGGFGAAKTWALCLKAIYLSEVYPRNRGLVGRRIWEELKHTTMSTFFKICPHEAYKHGRRTDSEKYLQFNNGSEILWAHLDNPETENVIRGIELNWFILDQAEEISEELFDLLMTRLGRWDKATVPDSEIERVGGIENWEFVNPVTGEPQVPTYPMIACNPDAELHWIYRRFHPDSPEHWEKRIPDPETGQLRSYHDLGYHMIQMKSYENKYLPKHNLQMMMTKDASFIRRFVEGQWGIPEGQIHDVDDLSLLRTSREGKGIDCDPYALLEQFTGFCTLHRSLDHGDASPTACLWWAVDGSGNVFCYREYYQPNKLISDHRVAITMLSNDEHYVFNLADPTIFFKTAQKHGGRWSVADEYSDVKYTQVAPIHWQAADNNELGTRNRINEYLRIDPDHIHPITKEKGSPRLFFILKSDDYPNGCYHVIKELRGQRRIKLGTDKGRPIFCDDRDPKIVDHAYDCCRYFLSSRPPLAREAIVRPKKGTWNTVWKRHQKFQKAKGSQLLAKKAKGMSYGEIYR